MLPGLAGIAGFLSAAGGGGSSGTAAYIGAEDTTGGTFSSSSIDALTINGATLKASTDYLLFASAEVSSNNTGARPSLVALNNASALSNQTTQFVPTVSSGDGNRSLFFMCKVTTGPSPSSDNFILRLGQNAANTITWDNARLVLIEVGANDKYAESRARQTWTNPTSATAQTACTLSFTPASSGRYLILAYLNGDISSGTHAVELTDGTNTTGEQRAFTVAGGLDRIPTVLSLELTLSGATTFTLKARNDSGTGTLGVADCCIIAIRLDRFVNAYGSARATSFPDVTLGSREGTPAWVNFTPNAGDHLILAFGAFSAGIANGGVEFDDGGTVQNAPSHTSNYSGAYSPFFSAAVRTYAAVQRAQKISQRPTTNDITAKGPSVFTLDLGAGSAAAAGSVAVRGHAIASSSGSSLALTLPAGSAAGDCMLLFTGHGFAPNDISGWLRLDRRIGSNFNGATYIKILEAADITAGSVTIGYAGSFNGVRSCIVFQGTPRQIRAYTASRNGAGSASRALSTDSTPRAGDYFIGFGSARVAATVSCNVGSQLRVVNAASASGVLNGGSVASDGAITATFSYGGAPSGDYQVIVIVSP